MQPQAINFDLSDSPTIKEFMESDAFLRAIMGPFGSGKSSGCMFDIINRGLRQSPGPDGVRRTRWAVVRNTYPMLRDTTIRTVHMWFPYPTFGRWRAQDHEYMLNTLVAPGDKRPAEIELLFRALDRPEHVKNLLSMDLTGAWINECREVPWAIVEAIQGRVDRYPPRMIGGASWAGVLMDTNPPSTDSEFFRFFEESDHSAAVDELARIIPGMTLERYCRLFKQPSGLSEQAENRKHQSPGYWHRLAIGKDDEWIKVYVKGEYGFVIEGRAVFEEYKDHVHCPGDREISRAPITDKRLPVQRGWDFGLTPACVFSQLTPRGQWKIVDELVATSMGIDRFSDEVLDHSARYFPGSEFEDIGDPAGVSRAETDERSCYDILRGKGVLIDPGLQAPQIRQECVRRQLQRMDSDGNPAFNIHPRCRVTRRGLMGGYHYRRIEMGGRQRYAERPEKNSYSHPVDAMCYTATHLFGAALAARDAWDDSNTEPSRLLNDHTRSKVTGY